MYNRITAVMLHLIFVLQKYNNNPSNVSGFIQPGSCNGGMSLTMGVPVSVGGKMAPTTLVVGTNEVSHHPVATKRIKIS
jgi:hypothetical protein